MKAAHVILLLVGLTASFFLGTERVEAATYEVTTCLTGLPADCVSNTYAISLNKATYAPNETIVASVTYMSSVCSNGSSVGSSVTATNNLDGVLQRIFSGTRTCIAATGAGWSGCLGQNVGQSGNVNFNAGSGAVSASSVTFRGSVVLHTGTDLHWFDIGTIPYTVSGGGKCTGTLPTNAAAWNTDGNYDQTGITGDVAKSYSTVDNPGTKCEFYCPAGSTWNGSACRIDGVCNNAVTDGCTAGTFVDVADTLNPAGYVDISRWQCQGSGGGASPACALDELSCDGGIPVYAEMHAGDGPVAPGDDTKSYSAANTAPGCQFYCTSGTWDGTKCDIAGPQCLGTIPDNAEPWNGDGVSDTQGLAVDTAKTYSGSDGAAKCQFKCAAGFSWTGSTCVASINGSCDTSVNNGCATGVLSDLADTNNGSGNLDVQRWQCNGLYGGSNSPVCQINVPSCDGTLPANASHYPDNYASGVDANKTYSPTDTAASCEYRCNAGYSWNGTGCVTPAVNGACGASSNVCSAGVLNDTADTYNASGYVDVQRWQCVGSGGGTSPNCTFDVPSCDGGIPANASFWNGDGVADTLNLAADTAKSYSPNDTAANCQYYCDAGYPWNGTSCGGAVNGVCGGKDTCTVGGYEDLADDASNYRWRCNGSGGGMSPTCTAPISGPNVDGKCGAFSNLCDAGTYQDTPDDTMVRWDCLGSGTGAPASCSASPVPYADAGNPVRIYLPTTTAYPDNPQGGGSGFPDITWTNTGRPGNAFTAGSFPTISNDDILMPEFGNLRYAGTYKFTLTVTAGVSAQDEVWFTVHERNLQPANFSVTSAGPYQAGTGINLQARPTKPTNGWPGGSSPFSNDFTYRWNGLGLWQPIATLPRGGMQWGVGPAATYDYATIVPNQGGMLNLQYCVDSFDDVGEAGDNLVSFEGDNCVELAPINVAAPANADLVPSLPTRSAASVAQGGTINFSTNNITNSGGAIAGPYAIGGFYVDNNGDGVAEYTVPAGNIAVTTAVGGSNSRNNIPWVVPAGAPAGNNYRISYIVDDGDAIPEGAAGEANNFSGWSAAFTVTTVAAAPSITIRACDLGGANCVTGGTKNINVGDEVEIQLVTNNATLCSATSGTGFAAPGASGLGGTDNTITEPAANNIDVFAVTCSGPGGNNTASVAVSTNAVVVPPTITSNPRVINMGDSVSLTINPGSDVITSCTLSRNGSVIVNAGALTSPYNTGALNSLSTYTVNCPASGSDSVTIEVVPKGTET